MTRPQVNFVVGDSYSRLKMSGLPGSTTRSPYVGVTVNFPFGGGTRDSLESGKLKVLSAEDNVRAQTDEFTYQITSNISRVISAEPVVAATSANLASLKDQIDRFRANVSSKSKIDKSTLDALIDTLNQFDKTAGDYYNLLGADLSYRYSLEVQIGILFDGVQFGFRNSNSVCANVRPISSPYLCK